MVYGLTGGIGSGKSTVANILRENGCIVIDADELSRDVTAKDKPLLRVLVKNFGKEIINDDGTLDRHKLADIAFADRVKTHRLNQLVQTAVRCRFTQIMHALDMAGNERPVFFDAPMLFEGGAEGMVGDVWLVTADENIRIKRVMERDGLSEEAIRTRIALQMPEEDKARKSSLIIVNDGTVEELKDQVLRAMQENL